MRKYFSILIVAAFLFNIEGSYIWFCVQQYSIKKEIRQEIRQGIKEEDLTLIIIPDNEETGICWLKPDKEFRYKDEMFDVVKIQIKHQKKYYYCLSDKKEKQLLAGYHKRNSTKKNAETKLKRTFVYNFDLQYASATTNFDFLDITFAGINDFYSSNAPDILSPPPKST